MTRRILAAVLGMTLLAVAAFSIPAALAIRQAHDRGELLELQREASIAARGIPATGDIDGDQAQQLVDSEHRLGLYSSTGELVAGVGPDSADGIVALALDGAFAEGRVDGDLVAAVPVRAEADGRFLVLRIEAPGSAARSRFLRALAELALAGLVIVGLSGAIAWLVARRINRPLVELGAWAADSAVTPTPPPPATGMPEVDSLRSDILANRARVIEVLERERAFSSHVSHQLRTPVAAMRVAIETELDTPRDDPAIVLQESLEQLDRLESTITSLLALARHGARPDVLADVGAVVAERADQWRAAIEAAGRDLEIDAPGVVVDTDPGAVAHVLDVLLENALGHGAGTVRITLAGTDREIRIEVGDDGPRPPDGVVSTSDQGHGIGLRLARALAVALGGDLALTGSATTTFRFTLPVADPTRRTTSAGSSSG